MATYRSMTTPLGEMILVAQNDALTGAYFADQRHFGGIDPGWIESDTGQILASAAGQLAEYFAGCRRRFELPIAPAGTEFQRSVWRRIAAIDYGRTATYRELATGIGRPDAVRAVGTATGRNPLSVIVGCHRVLGSDGSLTGYAGGLDRKRALLALERGERGLFEEVARRGASADSVATP